MSNPYDDFNKTVKNFDVSADDQQPPVLTEEQAKFQYTLIIPKLGQLEVNKATGKELLEYAEVLKTMTSINGNRIANRIYQFITSSQIGDYCWTGYMQPIILKAREAEEFNTIITMM